MSPASHLAWIGGAWALYGLMHSVLASRACKSLFKRHFPNAFRAYRLGFNLVSLCLLVPPLALVFAYPGGPLWQTPPAVRWLADAAALAALAGFVATLRIYDTGEFLGTRQLRKPPAALDDEAPMRLSFAHRFVRHPWYFLGLVIIWTREMNAAWLVTASVLTLYLLAGSRLEEKKLEELYGARYRDYRRMVPGLIPLPGRVLSKAEADRLRGSEHAAARDAGDRAGR